MSKKPLDYSQHAWLCKMMLTAILFALPLMSFFGSATLSAKTVTGVVTSATDNEPLIGVTVKVEGSSTGTITDFDGKYSINANPGQTIVFSYIGFVSKSVKVGAANTINVQYKLASTSDLSLNIDVDADCDGVGPANGAVCLVDIVDIRKYFSGFSAELKSLVNDGVNVPFDASKILYGDIENNGKFRVELHNIWGSTAANPAFDGETQVEGNNCVLSLGFQKSSKYTIGNFSSELFAKPW